MNFPIQNDAVVFGLLMAILGFVFFTASSENRFWKRFHSIVPPVLLCYLLPSLLSMSGMVDTAMIDKLYYVVKSYMLPCSLLLMTIGVDFKGLARLGSKALILFLTGTVGIIIGGPIAMSIVAVLSPETFAHQLPNDDVWRGLATLAGSWIGGGANQTAMLEVYEYNQSVYSAMVAVDIVCANVLMALLLYGAGISDRIDKWLGADATAINDLKKQIEAYRLSIAKIPTLKDTMLILGLGFGGVALSHVFADGLTAWVGTNLPDWKSSIVGSAFFWLVVISTTIGLALSATPAKKLEGAGASQLGSVCIYILVATIGMKMDLINMFDKPWLIVLGFIWLGVHISLMLVVAKLLKAPFFFVAVGSQANVGAAASAPVVASAFSPALAPVGVLLAVLGYALGTYGAIICAEIMRAISP